MRNEGTYKRASQRKEAVHFQGKWGKRECICSHIKEGSLIYAIN